MKNWRTTLAGIGGALVIGAAALIQSGQIGVKDWAVMAVSAVLGVLSKDFNVTGGAVLAK